VFLQGVERAVWMTQLVLLQLTNCSCCRQEVRLIPGRELAVLECAVLRPAHSCTAQHQGLLAAQHPSASTLCTSCITSSPS
jgi:hypothetical protein